VQDSQFKAGRAKRRQILLDYDTLLAKQAKGVMARVRRGEGRLKGKKRCQRLLETG